MNWDEHLEALFASRGCPTVAGRPVTGAVRDARIMLVGQAPGPREEDRRQPFAYTAGKRLFDWFRSIGVSEEEFRERIYIAAVIRCFPGRDAKKGGDRVPSPEEIARCGAHLDREIALLQPRLLLAVGTLAARVLLGTSELSSIVGRLHRVERAGASFDVIALPHPSGRSTWLNRPEHRQLMERSLQLIVSHEAFSDTFGSLSS
jgi:uracil-DNA glycosylase